MSTVRVRGVRPNGDAIEFNVDPDKLGQHLGPIAEMTADRGFTWVAKPLDTDESAS